jgi:hypothetical protein
MEAGEDALANEGIMRIVVAGLLAAGIVTVAARADPVQRWVPIDRTTMGVTGDIALDGDHLIFGNGASLRVKLVQAHKAGRWSSLNADEDGDVYKVDPPANPVLLRDNLLCDKPASYIVLSRPVPNDLYLSVYAGTEPPKGDGSEQSCAGYSYTEG